MGRKRRYKERDNSEHLLRKLTRELSKRRRRYSSSSTSSKYGSEVGEFTPYYEFSDKEQDTEIVPESPHVPHDTCSPPAPEVTVIESTPQLSTSTAAATNNDQDDQVQMDAEPLDEETLTLLGDAPKDTAPVGKDVHPDIASRLHDILLNGLKKEHKSNILEEYPIPSNCHLFKAPILNAEVKAAVSEILQKKDASLAARQGQVGVALSALANAMNILVTEKSDNNQMLLKHVSNACRLLCDSHYIDTKLRRNFLVSTLNNKLKDTLKESKRDKHLFGESLSENLKVNKAIAQSSQYLKPNIVKQKPIANNRPTNITNHLNWRNPQPNYQNSNRKPLSTVHRTAGSSSTAHRNGTTTRKQTSTRANRSHAQYKNQKKY